MRTVNSYNQRWSKINNLNVSVSIVTGHHFRRTIAKSQWNKTNQNKYRFGELITICYQFLKYEIVKCTSVLWILVKGYSKNLVALYRERTNEFICSYWYQYCSALRINLVQISGWSATATLNFEHTFFSSQILIQKGKGKYCALYA